MKKFVFSIMVLSISSSSFARNICEFDGFRSKNSNYCLQDSDGDWGPTPEFVTLAGGEDAFDDKFDYWGANERGSDGRKMLNNFKKLQEKVRTEYANSDNRFAKYSAQVTQTKIDAEAIRRQIDGTKQSIETDDDDFYKKSTERYLASLGLSKEEQEEFRNTVLSDHGHPSPKCFRDSECRKKADALFAFQDQEQENRKKELEKTQQAANDFLAETDKVLDLIDKTYIAGFKDLAKEELIKADPSLKGIEKISQMCKQAAKSQSPAIEVCGKLEEKQDRVGEMIAELGATQNEIRDAATPLDALMVDLKLDELSEKEKRIALNQFHLPFAKERLKGTALGHMFDQMREDMCSVATNPKMMCAAGSAFAIPSELVNDTAEIAKEFNDRRVNEKGTNISVIEE